MKCSNKPECSVIWSQETDCLGNLQQEKCSFQHYFDDLNIKGFICLVTADMFTSSGCPTLPKACVVLLCSRNLAYFSSSRPPLAKDCSKGWGAYFNDLTSFAVQWQSPLDSQSLRELSLAPALMPHTCKCVLDWWMLFLQTCFYVYLVIWSRAALEILYANTLQERYSVNKSILPANNVHAWMSYPGNERIPLTLETLTTFPSVFSRWGTASIVRCSTARTLVAITLCKVDPIIMRKFYGGEAVIVPGAFLHSELAVGDTFLWNKLSWSGVTIRELIVGDQRTGINDP